MGRRRNDKLELSPTERRLVGLLCCTGGTNKQLAVQLHMSPRTVGVHLLHVYQKFGVSSRGELMALAAREKWFAAS